LSLVLVNIMCAPIRGFFKAEIKYNILLRVILSFLNRERELELTVKVFHHSFHRVSAFRLERS
jgi:hypothetical protein